MANSLAWIKGPGWTPASEPSIEGWWKADSLVLNDGDPVASWSDSSRNGYTMTETGTDRPTYKTNIKNGLPAVLFNATTNQWLSSTMPASNKPLTIAAVAMSATLTTVNGSLFGSTSDGGMSLGNLSTDWRFLVDGVVQIALGGYTLVNSTWYIIALTYDGSGNWAMLNNGVAASGTSNQPFTGGNTYMGRRNGGVFWDGYIGEIMKFSDIVSTSTIDTYLNNRWAVH